MADNTRLNPGSGGDLIATEDLGAAGKIERIKLVVGDIDHDGGDVYFGNPLPVSSGATLLTNATLQTTATANGNGTAFTVTGMETVILTVSGLGANGTIITFQGSEDGTTFSNLNADKLGTSIAPAPTTTTNGLYRLSVAGLQKVQTVISSYSTDTITVTAHAAPRGFAARTVNSYMADGANTVEGTTTDAGVTTDANGTISAKLRGLIKIFVDVWDSTNHWFNINLAGRIAGESFEYNILDVAEVADSSNQTATALIKPGDGLFYGWVVNNHTSGTLKFYDGLDNTGEVLFDTITFAAGPSIWRLPAARKFYTGLYAVVGGTINYTPLFK